MLGRHLNVILGFLAVLVVATSPAVSKELEDRNWIEVRSPNFRVLSLLKEKPTIELARHLEMFRLAVAIITTVSSTEAAIPTEIYAVRRSSDFKKLGIDERFVAGIFMPGLRSNKIVIRDAGGMKETTTILHEYLHFLVRNHGKFRYPKWFDEGFAEYLSAAEISGKYFKIGLPPEHRRSSFLYTGWIPIKKILDPEDYGDWPNERKAMFYAEAWALVHYLHNRPDQESSVGQAMMQYIELVESGTDKIEAFEEAFGITAKEVNKQVRRYLGRGRFAYFRFTADQLLPDFEPEVVTLSRARVSLALARLALRTGEYESAKRWFSIAASDPSTRPWAEAGLGDLLKFRGEFEAAQPHFDTAVSLAPADPYCRLDLAEYWHSRAAAAEELALRTEYFKRARSEYVKAWQLDDSMPEIYAQYGQTFLLDGERYDKAIEMLEEAEYLLPSNLGIRLLLAEAYAGEGRREDAAEAARSVLAWSHDESAAAKRAAEILSQTEPDAEVPTSTSGR